ncbi:hypothetical protein CWM47_11995 [Spirosoma pollinicola]|uniref:Microcin J25-processing protein McjB C-terminal domain-containing protein n=1 Tax=Spirosoma pollinicola TaxID=2057025 RepID=A0A2K8YY27_9BACT|nr:hypothetical protein CWM47_11995 [Spirosoma pollinicola]
MSGSRQWLLVRSFVVLSTYKCLLLVFPFRKFLPAEQTLVASRKPLSEQSLSQTIWAIQVLSNRLPLGFTCLVQALSAKWLLNNHPDVRVCIGVHKSVDQGFSAHAWVVYKDQIILGEQPGQQFQPILDWH